MFFRLGARAARPQRNLAWCSRICSTAFAGEPPAPPLDPDAFGAVNPNSMLRPPETFETARLFARKPRGDDAPAVFAAYASDPVVTQYLTWKPYTEVAPLSDFLTMQAQRWSNEDSVRAYLLCIKGTDTPVGSIGMHFEKDRVMFGYVLGRAHWGKGLMAEALRLLVDWSLAQPELFRAYALCDVENPASARVMEKAGMTREGIFRRFHIAPNLSPEPRDCIVCAKVR